MKRSNFSINPDYQRGTRGKLRAIQRDSEQAKAALFMFALSTIAAAMAAATLAYCITI